MDQAWAVWEGIYHPQHEQHNPPLYLLAHSDRASSKENIQP